MPVRNTRLSARFLLLGTPPPTHHDLATLLTSASPKDEPDFAARRSPSCLFLLLFT